MPGMIVDVHTHIFPPAMIARREELARRDRAFAELYGPPAARMVSAEQLLSSMDRAAVDVAVAAGFWWDEAALAAEHAEYLLEAAAGSGGRIVAAVPLTVPLVGAGDGGDAASRTARSYVERGARALGELRTHGAGLAAAERAARLAGGAGVPLLLHCSEEVGHRYPGKAGGLTPGELWTLASHSATPLIAGHWGGGLPFYGLMPEVRALVAEGRLVFDTAASSLLYDPAVFELVVRLVGVQAVLWGSDFPLRDQTADRAAVERALPDEEKRAALLGGGPSVAGVSIPDATKTPRGPDSLSR